MSVESEDIYKIVELDESIPSYHDKKVETEKFGETEVSLFYIDMEDSFHILRYGFEEDASEAIERQEVAEFYQEEEKAYTVLEIEEEFEAVKVAENLLEALDGF
ncbi:MAG: hypothetical protein H8Z69_03930 [Nanohaloarchaea archaeon]|nr:hypothetical protein [Candidatus Nanohaloarchaea archaeon]